MDYSEQWEAILNERLLEAFLKYDPYRHRFLDCTFKLKGDDGAPGGWNLTIDPAHSEDEKEIWREIMRNAIRDRLKHLNPGECELILCFI